MASSNKRKLKRANINGLGQAYNFNRPAFGRLSMAKHGPQLSGGPNTVYKLPDVDGVPQGFAGVFRTTDGRTVAYNNRKISYRQGSKPAMFGGAKTHVIKIK